MLECLSIDLARIPDCLSPGGALFSSLGRQLRFILASQFWVSTTFSASGKTRVYLRQSSTQRH